MFASEPFGGLIPGAQGAVLQVLLRTGTPMTGRQIQRVTDGDHSLSAVQAALRTLIAMGLVTTMPAGRANLHTINNEHAAIPALRELVNPSELLRKIVQDAVHDDPDVVTVVLFGSAARGEATRDSDVDLAVITTEDVGWEGHVDLAAAVEHRFGGTCDILVYGAAVFDELAASGEEPVVRSIIRDRFLLYGAPVSPRAIRQVRAAEVRTNG